VSLFSIIFEKQVFVNTYIWDWGSGIGD